MHEYNGTSNSYWTTSSPKVKRVIVTVSEYDENGNIVKETVTETEYEESTPWVNPAPYAPSPYVYPYVTYTTSTGISPANPGEEIQ